MTRRMPRIRLRSTRKSYRPKSFVINVSGFLMIAISICKFFSSAASVLRMFISAVSNEAFHSALESYFAVKLVIRNSKLFRYYNSFGFFVVITTLLPQRTCISRSKMQSVLILDSHLLTHSKRGNCKLAIQSST